MTEHEARVMVRLLQRVLRGTPAGSYQNAIGQNVVQVTWTTGPVTMVSVRECVRYASWLAARGGPGGAWVKGAGE